MPPFDLRDQLQRTLGASFTIERELGGGGMARVFLAEETALHREVVIKVLPEDATAHVSVERFKREIAVAARLQHPHILELTVRPSGSGIRVNADMVNAENGVVRWSHAFESDRTGMSALGDQIADELVTALPGSSGSTRKRHQPAPDAYEAYLRERFFMNRFSGKQDFDSMLVYFQRAVAADSLFAEPYAAAASGYVNASGNFGLRLQEAYPKADTFSRRALALDSSNAEAYSDAAWVTIVLHRDWAKARRDIERAIALDPSSAAAHINYAIYLDTHGDPLADAIREGRLALRLDPYNAFDAWHQMLLYVAVDQPDSALAIRRQLDAFSPGFFEIEDMAGDAFRQKHMLDSALTVDLAASKKAGFPTSGLVVTYATMGRRADAERAYRDMVAASKLHLVLNEVLGRAAYAAGHHDEAISWFEKAVESQADFALEIRYLPDLRPLMRDPAYTRLLDKMGILHLPLIPPLHDPTSMKRLVFVMLAAALPAASAQQPEALSALNDIVGVWQSDTTQGTSARSNCDWTPQRGAVMCEQVISTPNGQRHALNLFTFDSATTSYVFYFLSQPGETMDPVPLSIHDHVWVYGGKRRAPDGSYHRTVNDFTAGESYAWRQEISADGTTWAPTGAGGRSRRVR